MANENDLVTWKEAEIIIGSGIDTESITMVQEIITAASIWANNYTSRNLKSRAYTLEDDDTLYDGDGDNYIMLTQYPVTTLSSVYEDIDRVYGSDTLVDSDDYIIYARRGKLLFTDYNIGYGYQNIKVLYTAGYITVPKDLQNAVIALIQFWYDSYTGNRFGVKSTRSETKGLTYDPNIPPTVIKSFNPYKKVIVG